MDLRGKWIRPRLAYVDGEFRESLLVKISNEGEVEDIRAVSDGQLPQEIVDLGDEAILPGFVNAHSHAFHRSLRGRSGIGVEGADNFWKWRDNMYKLVEEANYESIQKYCADTFAEMLRAGITSVGEFHYVHHRSGRFDLDRAVIEAATQAGIRLVLIETLYCRSGFDQSDVNAQQVRFKSHVDEFVEHVKGLIGDGLPSNVTLAVAAHSLRAVPVDQLKKLYEFACTANLSFHIHLEEQPKEILDCEAVECCTPSELLLSALPSVDGRLTAVHCTYTKRKNLNAFASKRINICVCPTTEGFLGDGVPNLEDADQLCLGTDCNNRLCFLEEIRWLAYGQNMKTNSRNAAKLDAKKLLKIATANGARSLGIARRVGKLETGFFADFVTIDLHSRRLGGIAADELADALIFGCGNQELKRTFVGGIQR